VLICNGCCFPNSPVNPLVVGSSPTRPLLPARKVRDPPKALHGHLLGGAGAQELLIAVAAMERGVLRPTMHLNAADAGCDLDYVAGAARTGVKLRAVMSNSFAFGGTNAALIARNAA
jgi:3-oxoacyl-(acyl-carrier-protein) synthase